MEADWYIDPLGRYEGRFFDGARWTHQVSDRGTLAFDPDWPPVARGRDAISATSQATTTTAATAAAASGVAASGAASASERVAHMSNGPRVEGASFVDDVQATTSTFSSTAPTAPTPPGEPVVRTSSAAESPARQVAVVSDGTASARARRVGTTGSSAERTMPSVSPRTGPTGPEPLVRDSLENEGSGRRWLYILGGLLLLAGLALALLPRLFGGDDEIADTDTPAVEVVQDVDSTEDPGAASTSDDGAAVTGASGGEVAVGAVTIRNGQSALADLTTWHSGEAANRDITLPADADCWFARRGDVAEPAAFCGPVGVDDQGRTLYDQFEVGFDDAGPQIVSATVDRESLIPNVAIEQGRELVDRDGEVLATGATQAPKRGERIRAD